jgi:hypothetical protein
MYTLSRCIILSSMPLPVLPLLPTCRFRTWLLRWRCSCCGERPAGDGGEPRPPLDGRDLYFGQPNPPPPKQKCRYFFFSHCLFLFLFCMNTYVQNITLLRSILPSLFLLPFTQHIPPLAARPFFFTFLDRYNKNLHPCSCCTNLLLHNSHQSLIAYLSKFLT